MQNVLVVEAVSSGRLLVEEIAQRGMMPFVVYPKLAKGSEEYEARFRSAGAEFARRYTPHIHFAESDSDMESFARDCRPCAIIAGSELGVAWADRLSSLLGLPGNDPKTSLCRRDKFAMQEALREKGVPCLRTARVTKQGGMPPRP